MGPPKAPPKGPKGPKAKAAPSSNGRQLKRKRDDGDLSALEREVQDLNDSSSLSAFSDLPLSNATASGLKASHFKILTTIQQQAIFKALKGRDILGAAKTGSGKTLAFLIPVYNLFRKRWTESDGLGALILSPTRELAIQIFEVLRKIGRFHKFSAGLVIGGKSLQEEQERLGRMNILVATPGRMLQHLDQTAAFKVDQLQILVLDEADRILDLGFQTAVDAIVDHLPKTRQTMLFSATQTKRLSDLARLSLKDPEYVAVHEAAKSATPETLKQHYVVTPLPEKLDTLWGFLRANTKSKILVFYSTAKQTRFAFETFRHMQPGIPLLHLHGRQMQTSRLEITTKYARAKFSCLFSTDVAARGLDFPAVDWVIQVDCPEDADTYIHRVGRTARYEREGRAVLFLDPSEKDVMLQRLEHKKITIEEIKVKEKKKQSIRNQLQSMCFKDSSLKYLGQKAFTTYTKSVFVRKDRELFDIRRLNLEEFATSLGLPGAPRINLPTNLPTNRDDAIRLKNIQRQFEDSSDSEDGESKPKPVKTRYDRVFERTNKDILSTHYNSLVDHGEGQDGEAQTHTDDEGAFFNTGRRIQNDALNSGSDTNRADVPAKWSKNQKVVERKGMEPLVIDSKNRERLLKSRKKIAKYKPRGSKLVFDDDGNPHEVYELEGEEDFKRSGPADEQRQSFVAKESEKVRTVDIEDKKVAREKRKEKKRRQKEREREEAEAEGVDAGPGARAVLAPYEDGDDMAVQSDGASEQVEERTKLSDAPERRPKRQKKSSGSEHIGKGSKILESLEFGNVEDLEKLAKSYL